MGGPTYRISWLTASFMIAIALVLDAIQFVLTLFLLTEPLAELATFIAIPVFGVWFLLLGVNYFGGKRSTTKVISALGSTVVELIPFVDALPGITLGVGGVIWASRKEDKVAFEEQQAEQQRQADERARQYDLAVMRARAANDRAIEEEEAA